MRVSWRDYVFVRHASNESIVWSAETDACLVLKDAKPFLDEIYHEDRTIDEICRAVAENNHCLISEALEDFSDLLAPLTEMGFVVCASNSKDEECDLSLNDSIKSIDKVEDASYFDFYLRHKLISDLHVDLTERCNERCVHCYVPEGGATIIGIDIVFRVLREFREMGGMSVIFSGGECMLHPEFRSIIKEARSLDLNIIILSNLTRLNDSTLKLLKEIKPQFVSVSLYSMDENEHDTITRVLGSWNRTMDSIMKLHNAGVQVRLATPILKENMQSIKKLTAFAVEYGFQIVFDVDIIGRIDHNCTNRLHALDKNALLQVLRENKELCHRHMDEKQCAAMTRVCDIGDYSINISARGDYYPCDGFHGVVLGNAHVDPLFDVWRGEKLGHLRSMRNRDFGECVACGNRKWCKVCAMRNYNETGDMYRHASFRCHLAEAYRIIEENIEGQI